MKLKENIRRFIVLYLLSALVLGPVTYWHIFYAGYFDQTIYIQNSFERLPGTGRILLSGFVAWQAIVISVLLLITGTLLQRLLYPGWLLLLAILSLSYALLVVKFFQLGLVRGLFYIPDEAAIAFLGFFLIGALPLRWAFGKKKAPLSSSVVS